MMTCHHISVGSDMLDTVLTGTAVIADMLLQPKKVYVPTVAPANLPDGLLTSRKTKYVASVAMHSHSQQ